MTEREAHTDDARDLRKHQVLRVKLEAGSDLVPPEQLNEPGVVSGRALDLKGGRAKPLVIRDPGVLDALRGVSSLTITGWYKRPQNFDEHSGRPQRILNGGSFYILFNRWGGIGLVMEGEDGRKKQVWSDWISISDFGRDARWTFFAFTYDGTRQLFNAAVYFGFREYEAYQVLLGSADPDRVSDNPDDVWVNAGVDRQCADGALVDRAPASLVIGADDADGGYKFYGALDSIRVFAGRGDAKAALSHAEIEQVRQLDLGREWVDRHLLARARAEQAARMEALIRMDTYWSDALNVYQVDSLVHVFEDAPPVPFTDTTHVPRGCKAPFQFAIYDPGQTAREFKISCRIAHAGTGAEVGFPVQFYTVKPILVEANNNAGIRTSITSRPPEIWFENLTRRAPFKVSECLVETDTVALRENGLHPSRFRSVLIEVDIPVDAQPGHYTGTLELVSEYARREVAFTFRVHDVNYEQSHRLKNVYWLSSAPENLTNRRPAPDRWSEEHWGLIRNTAEVLAAFGQTLITVTLASETTGANYQPNLIQTIREENGSYRFDYTLFDRWIETFRDAGFETFEGYSLFGGHRITAMRTGAIDAKTGEKIVLATNETPLEEWYAFLEKFLPSLDQHLAAKGWEGIFLQSICDEPTDLDPYKTAYAFTKRHLPSVRTKEACGNSDYSDTIDEQVFNSHLANTDFQELARRRREKGQGVWFYHCASPYPPFANRHLDEPLYTSRLYPWITHFLGADGYLWWAVNQYRGADPYQGSIGPLPSGSTDPGHPAGDNWMYFPGPAGLRGSMRMVAFREGLLDYHLISRLSEIDADGAQAIQDRIITKIIDYAKTSSAYHDARRAMLELLESRG